MLLVGERLARLGEVAEVVPGDGRLEPGRPEAGPHRLHGLEGMRQVDVLGGLEGVLVELPEWQLLCRRGADHHAERRGGEQAASDAVHGEVSLFRRLCIPSSLYERSLATRARSRDRKSTRLNSSH